MKELRNYGVYKLPDGHSYVLVRGGSGNSYLFDCAQPPSQPPVFQVTQEGRVQRWFNSGPEWFVEDLEDTGETSGLGEQFECPD
jgi:hypothetical protein